MMPNAALPVQANDRLIDGLVDTLRAERRLVDELYSSMVRQREAIANDDVQALDDSVFALQRQLLTLGEARSRRRALTIKLGCDADTAPAHLSDALGSQSTSDLVDAAMALATSARALSREVGVNQQILKQGVAAGEEFFRRLAAVAAPVATGYPDTGTVPTAATPGFLNRHA
jgi:hypothetical protein